MHATCHPHTHTHTHTHPPPPLVLPKNTNNFNVDNVRVVKVLGGNLQQSEVIRGMVIPHDTQGSVKRVKDAKVAVFSNSLAAAETETKGTVLIHSAAELMSYNLGEEKEIERVSGDDECAAC